MLLEREVEIARPPEEVFAFLAKHENHARFVVQNESSAQVSPGPMGVGTHVRNTARMLGRPMVETFEVTAFEAPRVIAKRSLPGSTFQTTDRFELTPTASGTRVTMQVTGTPEGLGQRIVYPIIERVLARAMVDALARLREILERGA